MTDQTPYSFSCEFFPPRGDDGQKNLATALDGLAVLKPDYISCTYGAGGTTQEGTFDTLQLIMSKQIESAAHITCIGSTKEKIRGLLEQYKQAGIARLVALRGDLPEGMEDPGEFQYANELVSFIRAETGDHFKIEVAAYPEMHPQANNMQADFENFKLKVNAGANAAITQYFYNIDSYLRFMDDCARDDISIPVIPGIMPITNFKQLTRFSAMCGAEIPRWISTRLQGYGGDLESIREFGLQVTLELCEQLLVNGAPGLHFYTMNRAKPTSTLWEQLDLADYAR